jgi:hypothetical protein
MSLIYAPELPALRGRFSLLAIGRQENGMKRGWIGFSLVALGAAVALAAADPALARSKHKVKRVCADPPYQLSWDALIYGRPAPRGNGCAPAVYSGGKYIGQDPDANIRAQLRRDPATGYPMDYQ